MKKKQTEKSKTTVGVKTEIKRQNSKASNANSIPISDLETSRDEDILRNKLAQNFTQWSDKKLEEYLAILFEIEMNFDVEGENINPPLPTASSELQIKPKRKPAH